MAIYLPVDGRALARWQLSSQPLGIAQVYLEGSWRTLTVTNVGADFFVEIDIIGPQYNESRFGPAPVGAVTLTASCQPIIQVAGEPLTGEGGWILLRESVAPLTTNVVSTYSDSSGNPIYGAVVTATLMGSNSIIPGSSAVDRVQTTRTAVDGSWVLSLYPSSLFGSDSFYIVKVAARESYEIVVPVATDETPVEISSILRSGFTAVNTSYLTGDMVITGDLLVSGNVKVYGILTSTATLEGYSFSNIPPTFPGNFQIIGDLTVSGTLKAGGSITVV